MEIILVFAVLYVIPSIINVNFLIKAYSREGVFKNCRPSNDDLNSVIPFVNVLFLMVLLTRFKLKPISKFYTINRQIQFFARNTVVTEDKLLQYFTKEAVESYENYGFITLL